MDNPKNRKTTIKSDEKVAFKSSTLRKYIFTTGGAILIIVLFVFSWAMYQDTKEKTIRLNELSGQVTKLTQETKHMKCQQAILNAKLEKQKADIANKDKQIEELKLQNASLKSKNEELVKKYKELVTP